MPYQSLKLRPGIDVEQSPLLNETGWSFSSAIRFFAGLAQKVGGFARLNMMQLIGVCRGMHGWADLSGNPYIACGTNVFLELFFGGQIYNITPIRATTNPAVDFSTINGSKVITIKDVANGSVALDYVNIIAPVSVGGIVLQGYYQIQTVVDPDNYTIMAASNATATVNHGGAVPSFTTINTNPNVTVLLNNHGYIATNVFPVEVSTTVGGFTLLGSYAVAAVTDANHFTIQPGGNATSGATVAENAGNARLQYLIHSGLVDATPSTTGGGYGLGPYGGGPYGVSGSGAIILLALRQWFLDNFGQDLIGNFSGSPLYVWVPPDVTTPAIELNTTNFPGATDPPLQVNFSFVAAPYEQVIALGCNIVGTSTFDPLLVRWCTIGDFTDWFPTDANSAGSFHIPEGSKLTGGISAPNFIVVWTDIGMWLMNFLGGTGSVGQVLVFGFNKVADGVEILAARAAGVYRNIVFWPSSNGFLAFDGNAIRQIPCSVWDKFWGNLDRTQIDKVNASVNSYFQEISWNFPSLTGNGEVDSRITYNIRENVWTYDDPGTLMSRTAFIDENVYGAPIGTDINGYLQQQDTDGTYDADGSPLPSLARSGWFSMNEGSLLTMIERIEADFIASGGGNVQLTVFVKDYANGPVRQYGPYNWNTSTGLPYWSIVRARGRFASIQISSTGLGTFWRQGNIRYLSQSAGRRP